VPHAQDDHNLFRELIDDIAVSMNVQREDMGQFALRSVWATDQTVIEPPETKARKPLPGVAAIFEEKGIMSGEDEEQLSMEAGAENQADRVET
jgi:hypothetical protein